MPHKYSIEQIINTNRRTTTHEAKIASKEATGSHIGKSNTIGHPNDKYPSAFRTIRVIHAKPTILIELSEFILILLILMMIFSLYIESSFILQVFYV